MTAEPTPSEIGELLPAYVLGALDPDEMLAVARFLDLHPEWTARVQALEEAAASLATLAPPAALSPQPKAQLLARVRASQAGVMGDPWPSNGRSRLVAAAPARGQPGLLARLRSLLAGGGAWSLATACALLLLVGLALYAAQLRDEVSQMQADLNRVQAQIAELEEANATLEQTNEQLQQQAELDGHQLALLASADHTVRLEGTDAAPQAGGAFHLADGEGVLVIHGLEPLPDGQTYQLWLIPADGSPTSAGVMTVEAVEPASMTIALPATPDDFAAVGISIEPAGGSRAPTGDIVMLGEVG